MGEAVKDKGSETEPRTICVEIEGRSVMIDIRREGHARSRHTGRELRELHGWITTSDPETHRWLTAALRRLPDSPMRSTDQSGEFSGKWLVSWNSYAETAGLHTYTLILRENEDLSLEALLLGELELHPYEYRERVIGDGLTIWAKLVGTPEDLERLRGAVRGHEVLSVVRRGIQDQPREMRLGVAEWSMFEDRVKYRLVLVDTDINEGMRLELARIEEENSRAALGYYENFLERLTDLLVHRGLVSAEDIQALREAARTSPGVTRHDFWRVADVDAL